MHTMVTSRLPSGELAMVLGLSLALQAIPPGRQNSSTAQAPQPSEVAPSAQTTTADAAPSAGFDQFTLVARDSEWLGGVVCQPFARHARWEDLCGAPTQQKPLERIGARNRPPKQEEFDISPLVTRWLPVIEKSREAAGLERSEFPSAAVLALIHVESQGNPWKRKFKGSHYYGLLQMGPSALDDLGLRKNGRHSAKSLHGDGRRSIQLFFRYQRLYYNSIHKDEVGYSLERTALLWKMGPGSLATIRRKLREGMMLEDAVRYSARRHRIVRSNTYLRRFYETYSIYSAWMAARDDPS